MTAADRPSVTDDAPISDTSAPGIAHNGPNSDTPSDDARAEATTEDYLRSTAAAVGLDPERVSAQRREQVERNAAAWAAGRAETTTTTTCPACGSSSRFEVREPCSLDRYDPHDWHGTDRAETTTATVEDAQVLAALNAMHPKAAAPSLDYWGTEADKMRVALRAAGLFATARTHTTREPEANPARALDEVQEWAEALTSVMEELAFRAARLRTKAGQ